MDVTLDGTHDDDAVQVSLPGVEVGFDDVDGPLHGLGCGQDLGKEDQSLVEHVADLLHTLGQALVDGIFWGHTFVHGYPGVFLRLLNIPCTDGIGELIQDYVCVHGYQSLYIQLDVIWILKALFSNMLGLFLQYLHVIYYSYTHNHLLRQLIK